MTDSDDKYEFLTEEELATIDANFKKTEEEGVKNILKHFDRIHDKLFTFNNILIAGYFALSKIKKSLPIIAILIPILNLGFLIYIEYKMMEKSRFEADITKKTISEIKKHGKEIEKNNCYSLTAICTTTLVTAVFLYYLF